MEATTKAEQPADDLKELPPFPVIADGFSAFRRQHGAITESEGSTHVAADIAAADDTPRVIRTDGSLLGRRMRSAPCKRGRNPDAQTPASRKKASGKATAAAAAAVPTVVPAADSVGSPRLERSSDVDFM